jgi:hypothetical protein
MIDLPTKAEVHCADGLAGRSTYVIGNPINRQITHLVVQSLLPPFHEYLVPVDQVAETTDNRIKLKCTRSDLRKMELFNNEEFIRTESAGMLHLPYVYPALGYMSDVYWPYAPAEMGYPSDVDWSYARPEVRDMSEKADTYRPVKRQNVPPGESALRRAARVEATDGYVGQLDELLINSQDMQVTHLVLLERHIFQQREITIPVSQIDHLDQHTIYLKLDRRSVEELPTTPIQRWTRSVSKGGDYVPSEGD